MRAALGFLTVLGGPAPPDRRALGWFAAVGALVGLAVGLVWWGAGELWPPLVAAALAVAADAALTGMLHLDGLADSADGLLPPVPRARRLAIMRTPDVGAFGVATLVLVLVLRVAALSELAPDPLLVAAVWALARGLMAHTVATLPYARSDGGAATGFGGGERAGVPLVLGALIVAAGALVVAALGWPAGFAALAAVVAGFAAVVALAWRRLGGYTGDVLGAAGVVAETAGLLAAAARW